MPDQPDPPGTARPRRYVPRLHWELIACGTRGHLLAGTDAAELRPEDAILARPGDDGTRWYRCLRCDGWLSLPAPGTPARPFPPGRDELELPLRGRPLRDKVVLRLIALDRALHFVILTTLAILIFAFLENEDELREPVFRAIADLQNGLGGPEAGEHGLLAEIRRLFSINHGTLERVGVLVALFAIVEGVEAVGLWLGKRWAEYLTFIATTALLPLELYEITHRVHPAQGPHADHQPRGLRVPDLREAAVRGARRRRRRGGAARARRGLARRRAGHPALSSALQQLAQHERQDPAVLEVLDLLGRVDPHAGGELLVARADAAPPSPRRSRCR